MFKPPTPLSAQPAKTRFNLLSEILFVQATIESIVQRWYEEFQSLERDSVCSSADVEPPELKALDVSIS